VIGIKFGTTSLAAAYSAGGRVDVIRGRTNEEVIPAAFGAPASPENAYLVGQSALHAPPQERILGVRRLLGHSFTDASVSEMRRRFPNQLLHEADGGVTIELNGRTFTPEEVAGHLLRDLRSRAEHDLGNAVTNAVITVPLHYTERERAATRAAAESAGFDKAEIIDEDTATVVALQRTHTRDRRHCLIFHLGGGTCNASIVQTASDAVGVGTQVFPIQFEGDNWLGGDDFDERILQHIFAHCMDQYRADLHLDSQFLEFCRPHAKAAREQLSHSKSARIAIPYHRQGNVIEMALEQTTYAKLIEEDVDRAMAVITRAMERQGLRPDDLDVVLLTGGATMTPLIRERLLVLFGASRTYFDGDPRTAAAMGAAMWSAIQGPRVGRPSGPIDDQPTGKERQYEPPHSRPAQAPVHTRGVEVFISASSNDDPYAAQVWSHLSSRGIAVFFSPESLPELGSSDYRREIDRSLDEARHMIVVTSSVENVLSPWVEAEWGFFINEKRSGRKTGNLVTVIAGALDLGDLPPSLRYYEVLTLGPKGLEKLLRYLQR
jgi:molecular chaperone DnaK (HSP70)